MSRIFNSRGIVVADFGAAQAQVDDLLSEALAADCHCITVDVLIGQLLYLGNRPADALAAIKHEHCQVYYSGYEPPKRSRRRKS
jgi:methylmalonyl-CoA mutase cobalamin-binding subunit